MTKTDNKCDVCGCQTDSEFLTETFNLEFPVMCPECHQEWLDYCDVEI